MDQSLFNGGGGGHHFWGEAHYFFKPHFGEGRLKESITSSHVSHHQKTFQFVALF